jgi:hypothetical protein
MISLIEEDEILNIKDPDIKKKIEEELNIN